MAPSKRERQQAAKRQAKWEARLAAKKARRKKIYGIVAGVVVLALVVVGIVMAVGGDGGTPEAQPTPDATATPEASPGQFTLPPPSYAEDRAWTATLTTSVGTVELELDGANAPQAVASFVSLARAHFFDNTRCHRLTTAGIFVLQCGDPTATGTGGPGYTFGPIENAPANDLYPAGTLAMARRGGDGESMGSQFFLVYEDSTIPSDAAGGYTVFGRVTSGLEHITAVADAGVEGGGTDGPPATPVTIEGVEVQ